MDRNDKPLVPWDPFYSTPTPTTTPNKPKGTQQKEDFPALAGGSKSKNTNNNVLQANANAKTNPNLDPTASAWTPNTNLSANPDYDGLPFPKKHAWDTKPPAPHIFKDGTPINPPENRSATTSRQEGTGSGHGALPIHTKPENINPTGPSAKTVPQQDTARGVQKVNSKIAAYGHRVSHDTLTYAAVGWDSPAWENPNPVYTSLERSKLSTYLRPETIERMKTAGHWIGKDGSYENGKVKYERYVSGLEEGMKQEREQADEINRIARDGSVFEKNCEREDWGWFRERDPLYMQPAGAAGNGGGNGGGIGGGGGGPGNGPGRGDFGGGRGRGGDRGGRGGRGRGRGGN